MSTLESLQKSPPKFVEQVFLRVYQTRLDEPSQDFVDMIAEQLQEDEQNTRSIINEVLKLISVCVYDDYDEEKLQKKHGDVIAAVITKHINRWREQAVDTQVSLPQLIDSKWRIDIKSASHVSTRMAAPTVNVQLLVQNPSLKKGVLGSSNAVNFELNVETLETMLNGMIKIKDQLSSIK
ncbi:hypothetical protein AKO1_014827 [Acrasis kona]|uniref:COMM domain-containing protein n=1 Tax=Acrasis kona TaxID=1008807 RepID=A0AAW2Z236_9EUKA